MFIRGFATPLADFCCSKYTDLILPLKLEDLNMPRRSRGRRPTRKYPSRWVIPGRPGRGSVGVLPNYPDTWNDYEDYPDTYTDYGDYSDTYPDYNDGVYHDYGDYNDTYPDYSDSGMPGFGDPPWLGLDQKIIILEQDTSYLLTGDPDAESSLFEGLKKDKKGRMGGVLPLLLNQGWQVGQILPADPSGRSLVILNRPKRGKK